MNHIAANPAIGGGPVAPQVTPNLTGVPETMLWTLYSRASEAKRDSGILADPAGVRIFDMLDYDFERQFGEPNRLFAVRAAAIDRLVRQWLRRHPDGLVVSLGEGLETQASRVDNGRMRWLSVDLPDAIAIRERFLPDTERFRNLAASALDPVWMDRVPASGEVFIVAQGLFMYLEPETVETLFKTVVARFPRAELAFDIVPRSLSAATLRGLQQTPNYRIPHMPWGLNRREVRPTLRRWAPHLARVRHIPYRTPGRRPAWIENLLDVVSPRRPDIPSLMHITI